MAESGSCTCLFREVTVVNSSSTKWKEITVTTGASASTLQDIKVPDTSGGYPYKDSGVSGSPVRNRFIYWRTSNDVLELVEESLDLTLMGSQVKYHFQDTPILGGISIHENHGNVVILVSTVASVHRLVFPHPNKLVKQYKQDLSYVSSSDTLSLSVFSDASLASAKDPKNFHMINPGGSITSQLQSAASCLTADGEALFAFATQMGSILLVKMPQLGIQGIVMQFELCQSTMMQRLWTGLVPAVIRGGQESGDAAISIVMHSLDNVIYIFTVCRDHKLRMWSTKSQECVMVSNLLDFTPESMAPQLPTVGARGHILKKVQGSSSAAFKLCVFLSFADRNQFCIVEPEYLDNRYQLSHVMSVFGPMDDLTDFSVTSHQLWSMWTSPSGDTIVRVASLYSVPNKRGDKWSDVLLEPPDGADVLIPSHSDPREVYLQRIFQPGRFSLHVIQKALHIYKRSMDVTFGTDGMSDLKSEVIAAVENEISTAAVEYEMQEDEYYQLQLGQWSKLYSHCIQYQEVGGKPRGLFSDHMTGLIGIIRKDRFTYLRPCDRVEALYVSSIPVFTADTNAADNWEMHRDVQRLGECLRLISWQVHEDVACQYEQALLSSSESQSHAEQMVNELFFNTSLTGPEDPVMGDLMMALQGIEDLGTALSTILALLDLSNAEPEDQDMDDSALSAAHAARQMHCGRLFSSSRAVQLLSESLHQYTDSLLAITRDLLMLQLIVLRVEDKINLTPATSIAIKEDYIPWTRNLSRCYMTLNWISRAVALPRQPSSLDFNMRQMASLEISDTINLAHQRPGFQNASLGELFIHGVGGNQARIQLAQSCIIDESPCSTWTQTFLPLVKEILSLLWPLGENFLFPEFLMGTCQYLHLQEYIRMLNTWSDWNAASRKFLLGQCYMHFNEPLKAVECFTEASQGVAIEPFFCQKLLQTEETEVRKQEVLYYLKVIRQFEQFCMPDMVISLANTAISIADDGDPNVPTLWSKAFKYHLELGHNEEAYSAMISNPDPSRRKDCLRQLLVLLCERGDLQALVQFPYVDLEDEVVSILESRARSVDLATHNYYHLLYAFHIFRNNFRKAGSVMYEHGMRLGRELPGLRGLQQQAQCYLATLNTLRLVKPEYAWIVKPVPSKRDNMSDTEGSCQSPKHSYDGEEKSESQFLHKMEILELSDIEKEYMLVDARLRLIRHHSDPTLVTGPTPYPDELVGLLVKDGLYDRAIIVSKLFGLSLVTVFESLALRCIQLAHHSTYHMRGDNDYTTQSWSWLEQNTLPSTCASKETSASDQAWQLLQAYLSRYEDSTALYHRCVTIRLLSHGFTLPTWFINSYKKLNPAELLRLYIDYDLLPEAVTLAVEYVDMALDLLRGKDSQMFNLKGCLKHRPQAVWLPYVSIDQLLAALDSHQTDIVYGKLYEQLKAQMTLYLGKIRDVSQVVIEAES